jgi:HK97 family phage prohead protease
MPESVPLVDRAWSTLTVKNIDSDQRMIEGWASKPEVDRLGDIVEPLGCAMKIPFPLLWAHKHDEPVGHVIDANATNDGIAIRARIARIPDPGPLKDLVDKAWQAVKAGLCQGLSIGFKPREYEPLEGGGLRFTKADIYELSLVVIPACASATITMIRSIDQGMTAAGWQPPALVELPPSPVVGLGAPRLMQRQNITGTLDEEPLFALRMRGWRKIGQTPVAPAEYRNGYPLYIFAYEKLG